MSTALKSIPSDATELFYVHRRPVTGSAAIEELAVVALLVEARTFDTNAVVPAGTSGTVVMVHDDGAAYDVEFSSPVGVASVSGDDVAPVRA